MSEVVEIYEGEYGSFRHHIAQECEGPCPFHRPSRHKMREWPMLLRIDGFRYGLIERMCPHGIGHPDPDSVRFLKTDGTHGCDGCCSQGFV